MVHFKILFTKSISNGGRGVGLIWKQSNYPAAASLRWAVTIGHSGFPRTSEAIGPTTAAAAWCVATVVLAPGDRSLSCGKNVECWKRGTAGVACTGQESPGVRDPARARNCWRPTTVSETRLYSFVVGTAQSCSIGASAGQ